jgi:hypothetical protein
MMNVGAYCLSTHLPYVPECRSSSNMCSVLFCQLTAYGAVSWLCQYRNFSRQCRLLLFKFRGPEFKTQSYFYTSTYLSLRVTFCLLIFYMSVTITTSQKQQYFKCFSKQWTNAKISYVGFNLKEL